MARTSWQHGAVLALAGLLGLGGTVAVQAADTPAATFTVRQLTPETALRAVQAALTHCRGLGYQVSAVVVDRAGLPQALLRDRLAGAHTPDVATRKAWTAVSVKMSSAGFAAETQAGKPMSGLRGDPRFMAAGGGLPIEAGGSLLGAIGVSGAPGGDADEACAAKGLQAIADDIEF